ncbi:MAG: class I SAM-dependent methyltransferase [Oscillospiraceae bacterium]|nr:class I SAM-dependent methyltransferase [Oscillospiraceae bacterium]
MTIKDITKQVTAAYDKIANEYQNAYAETDEFDLKYVELFSQLFQGKRVVDLGCGIGTNAAYLTRKGFDVIGIDNSRKMLDVAKDLYPQNTFMQMNILDLPSSLGKFDGVILSYVVNHFNKEMLNKLKTVVDNLLFDDGVVYIAAHLGNEERIVSDPLDANIQLYYNFLSASTLNKLFQNYDRMFIETRTSFGEEEFLCDKVFIAYRKKAVL